MRLRNIPAWFVCLAVIIGSAGFAFRVAAQTTPIIGSPYAQSSVAREESPDAPGDDAAVADGSYRESSPYRGLSLDEGAPDIPSTGCNLAQTVAGLASPIHVSLETTKYSGGAAIPSEPIPNEAPVSDQRGRWGGEQWLPAMLQGFGFTVGQHAFRLATEQKTRKSLDGHFWENYWTSVNGLHTWSDGGKFWTNYMAHSAQGAVYGYIWVEHDPHGSLVQFGQSRAYWISRVKAFWWMAAWELEWKLGPLSEASIGNVGLKPGTLGAEDEVNTPVFGTALLIGEDAADRFIIAKLEKKTESRTLRGLMRTFFNPSRSLANVIRKKYPWYRETRPTLRDLAP